MKTSPNIQNGNFFAIITPAEKIRVQLNLIPSPTTIQKYINKITSNFSSSSPPMMEFDYDPSVHNNYEGIMKSLLNKIGAKEKRVVLSIKYMDHDGDWVNVSSDEEWVLAVNGHYGGMMNSRSSETNTPNRTLDVQLTVKMLSRDEVLTRKASYKLEKMQQKFQEKLIKKEKKISKRLNKYLSPTSIGMNVDFSTGSMGSPTGSEQGRSFSPLIAEPSAPIFEHDRPVDNAVSSELSPREIKKLEKIQKCQERTKEREAKLLEKERKILEKQEHKDQLKEENQLIAADDIELYNPQTQEFSHRLPPEIHYVYIDSNNMLYITYVLRTLVLFQKDKASAEKLLIYIARLFKSHMEVMLNHQFILFNVCFDSTGNTMSADNETFVVSSASDNGFLIADDMLVDIANRHHIAGTSDSCLFVTSDRGLRKKLKECKTKCVGSGQWLKFCYYHLCGETATTDMNSWMSQLLNEMD
ncbi:hypothetical protein C9374_005056 [Naegleria lovaniensis]|uniref:PB1 domain-containing protein n=1 Tax=Naegleria lovaniensis TaxID=51637 RepID=A0AA88KNE3_NAELO|nr:uncharacterized protein C9374_005056 [Naegleria lovaniensis]KAG2382476.1 hypothetical protein C9374_005056 [Naegleria lovaniensis]